jgi:hypothetical protein
MLTAPSVRCLPPLKSAREKGGWATLATRPSLVELPCVFTYKSMLATLPQGVLGSIMHASGDCNLVTEIRRADSKQLVAVFGATLKGVCSQGPAALSHVQLRPCQRSDLLADDVAIARRLARAFMACTEKVVAFAANLPGRALTHPGTYLVFDFGRAPGLQEGPRRVIEMCPFKGWVRFGAEGQCARVEDIRPGSIRGLRVRGPLDNLAILFELFDTDAWGSIYVRHQRVGGYEDAEEWMKYATTYNPPRHLPADQRTDYQVKLNLLVFPSKAWAVSRDITKAAHLAPPPRLLGPPEPDSDDEPLVKRARAQDSRPELDTDDEPLSTLLVRPASRAKGRPSSQARRRLTAKTPPSR